LSSIENSQQSPAPSAGKQVKSRSIGDDRDIRLFNSYFKAAHHSKSPSSSESGVATDDDHSESPKTVRIKNLPPLNVPEIANEYMVVIDDITGNRHTSCDDVIDDDNLGPIVSSPLPSIISFEEEIARISSTMLTTDVAVSDGFCSINDRTNFAADVVLDINATSCELLYRLNRPPSIDQVGATYVSVLLCNSNDAIHLLVAQCKTLNRA
jgi:hypothetical protein